MSPEESGIRKAAHVGERPAHPPQCARLVGAVRDGPAGWLRGVPNLEVVSRGTIVLSNMVVFAVRAMHHSLRTV